MRTIYDPMTYQPHMQQLDSQMFEEVQAAMQAFEQTTYTAKEVQAALRSTACTVQEFAALLSPAAQPFLEQMAEKAKREREKHFGNCVQLFTPLYISNYCENECVYCGFNCKNKIHRSHLNMEEVEKKYFPTIGLEVYPLNVDEYQYLNQCGADFVTVFQETYHLDCYEKMHQAGAKRCMPYRFYAQERAILGGMRGVGFGALLGLSNFRSDMFAAGYHAYLLQKKYPHAEIAMSFPRLRPYKNHEKTEENDVHETQLLQMMLAVRIFLPFASITISTRERAGFRDHVLPISATKISAGVNVGIGGHTEEEQKGDAQFEISDGRSLSEIHQAILEQGMQPVYTDYINTNLL